MKEEDEGGGGAPARCWVKAHVELAMAVELAAVVGGAPLAAVIGGPYTCEEAEAMAAERSKGAPSVAPPEPVELEGGAREDGKPAVDCSCCCCCSLVATPTPNAAPSAPPNANVGLPLNVASERSPVLVGKLLLSTLFLEFLYPCDPCASSPSTGPEPSGLG